MVVKRNIHPLAFNRDDFFKTCFFFSLGVIFLWASFFFGLHSFRLYTLMYNDYWLCCKRITHMQSLAL